MDSNSVLIAASSLILLFHFVDVVSHRMRIPSVIVLLAIGMAARPVVSRLFPGAGVHADVLQGLGFVGLGLIVLDGSMGLRWKSDSRKVFVRAGIASLAGIALFLLPTAALFRWTFDLSWKGAVLHAAPLSVVSSAIAIPSAARLAPSLREFISVESSFSDILGVLLFNAIVLPGALGMATLAEMGWRSAVVLTSSILVVAILFKMLRDGSQHVRFVPILASLILFYSIGKLLHLPSLLLVFLFGLAFTNLGALPAGPLRDWLVRDEFADDAKLMKTLVVESAFLARTFFFFLFGFSLNLSDLASPLPWLVGSGIVGIVYASRWIVLKSIWKGPSRQLLFIAPRGLITVLLMGMVPAYHLVGELATGPVLVVILGTTLAQLLGGKDVAEAAGMHEIDIRLPLASEGKEHG